MKSTKTLETIALWGVFLCVAPLFLLLLVPIFLIARFKTGYKQKNHLKPYVLWGPHPIMNIKYNSQAVWAHGYKSDTLVYDLYHNTTREDFDYAIKIFKSTKLHFLSVFVLSYPIFLWALWKYDIFQFYFNGGYLSHTPLKLIELPILKAARKKIIVSPYGGDVTQPSKVEKKYKWNIAMFYEQNYTKVDEVAVSRNIRYFCKYADCIIGVGELTEYLPRYDVCLPMNSTIDISKWKPVYKKRGKIIKIVHAPNHRALKGTQYLIEACNELKEEGYPVELVMVEKMSNKRAKGIYESADIIADQFLIGWYALFAAEGMALGKPVLCYLRENLIQDNEEVMQDCPIINTNPDTLKKNLKLLIEDEDLCSEKGRKGREYVEKYGIDYVGIELVKIYQKLWVHRTEWHKKQKAGLSEYTKEIKTGTHNSDGLALRFGRFCDMKGATLDIGCGIRPSLSYTKNSGENMLIGIDPLRGDSKRSFCFVQAVGEHLPFRNKAFDNIVFATSLDHFITPEPVLEEAKRVLKEQGEINIWSGCSDWYSRLQQKERKKAVYIFCKSIEFKIRRNDKFHFNHFTIRKILSLLKRAGFINVRIERVMPDLTASLSVFVKAEKRR